MFSALAELFVAFIEVGFAAFGGGYAAIPVMEKVVVEKHGWLSQTQMAEVAGLSQIAPGSIAINASCFVGFRVAGIAGAVVATIGVMLPSVLILLAIALLFRKGGNRRFARLKLAIRPGVLALIALAAISIGKGVVTGWEGAAFSVLAFFLFAASKGRLHPVPVLISAGLISLAIYLLSGAG